MQTNCGSLSPADCFGTSSATIFSLGAQVYYRIKDNLFGIGNIWVSQMGLTRETTPGMTANDPAILSLTGFARVAYRF